MKLQTCPDDDTLQRFLLGEPLGDHAGDIESHFESCDECGRRADSLLPGDTLTVALATEGTARNSPIHRDIASRAKAAWSSSSRNRSTASDETSDGHNTDRTPDLSFLAPAEQDDEIGRLGDYRILDVLGAGGMGIVLLAEDPDLQRRIALKVMQPSLGMSPTARERFLREARAAATVTHDHIVTIHQVGEAGEVPFLAMQLLEGESLAQRLTTGKPLSTRDVVAIARQTAAGLGAAHDKGLIHRDIKPDNVWLEAGSDRVKLLDFGLARSSDDQLNLTQSGMVVGTPSYLAPEQTNSRPVDARTDLFSVGVVMYEMLTRVKPFDRDSLMATMRAIDADPPRPINKYTAGVPESLVSIVIRLLQKSPQDRFQNSEQLIEALDNCASDCSADELQSTAARPQSNADTATLLNASVESAEVTSPMQRDLKPQPAPSRSDVSHGGRNRWLIALAGFAAVVLAAVVYRIQTDHGTLIVTIEDKAVEARLKEAGIDILDAKNNRVWTIQPDEPSSKELRSGEYKFQTPAGLLVTDDTGAQITANEFRLLDRDGEVRVHVSLSGEARKEPASVMTPPVGEAPETNGTELAAFASDREAAEWALGKGFSIAIVTDAAVDLSSVQSLDYSGWYRTLREEPPPFVAYVEPTNDLPKVEFRLLGILEPAIFGTQHNPITTSDIRRIANLENLFVLIVAVDKNAAFSELTELRQLRELMISGEQLSDKNVAWERLIQLPHLSTFGISQAGITDDDLATLAKIPELRVLELRGNSQVTDAGLIHLARTTLECLGLHGNAIIGPGLLALKDVESLRCITDLQGDAAAEALSQLPQLEYATMKHLTDDGFLKLARLPELTYLGITDSDISEQAIRDFARQQPLTYHWRGEGYRVFVPWVVGTGGQMTVHPKNGDSVVIQSWDELPSESGYELSVVLNNKQIQPGTLRWYFANMNHLGPMRSLDLNGLSIDDAALTNMELFRLLRTSLQSLNLSNTQVTDATLKAARVCRSLKRLNVSGTAVTQFEVDVFRAARPDCEIIFDPAAVTSDAGQENE